MLLLFLKSLEGGRKTLTIIGKNQDLGQYLQLMKIVSKKFKLEHHIGLELDVNCTCLLLESHKGTIWYHWI
jgi:hypothetical protein